jgi:adenosylmethionine-8-amino-7-oxononanoate aminotransferase
MKSRNLNNHFIKGKGEILMNKINNQEGYNSKKWQDSFMQIAISEAEGHYLDLLHRNGEVETDRRSEYATVIKQQSRKTIDEKVKKQMDLLAYYIEMDDPEGVKKTLEKMKLKD